MKHTGYQTPHPPDSFEPLICNTPRQIFSVKAACYNEKDTERFCGLLDKPVESDLSKFLDECGGDNPVVRCVWGQLSPRSNTLK